MQKLKMIKKLQKMLYLMLLILTFTTTLTSTFAVVEDMNDYEYLKLQVNNDISFNLDIENVYNVNTFEVSSYFLPQTFQESQYLNSFETSNEQYQIINNSGILSLRYFYTTNSIQTKNKIENTFIIESTKFQPVIKQKVKYPITNVPKEYQKYLGYEGLIDIDENIRSQASSLAQGEDDTFIIASKIAKWIREDINYDLTTVTENPNQKSTQVFQSKAGVCKEISNLYISMMRALGIPSRVITGYAYTNSQELINFVGSPWGGHAWVEVLIGDKWVPFDLTYNQYGYVDATHIILDKSAHIRPNSLYINSTGYGYKFAGDTVTNTDFVVLDKSKKIKSDEIGYQIDIQGPNEIGFGSYGYLKTTIKNKDNYYKILFLSLSKITEVENLDSNQKMVIFKPNEEKEIYFRYKITDDLKTNYQYTFPFTIYNEFFEQEYEVKVREEYLRIKQIALPQEEETQNQLSNNDLNFNCNYILSSPQNTIICSVKNPNNYEINNLQTCIKQDCQRLDLKLNEQKTISFETLNYKENLTYKYEDKSSTISLNLEMPKITYNTQIINDGMYINYEIENYVQKLTTNIYLNNQLYMQTSKEQESIYIPLNQTNNTLKLKITYLEKTLQEEQFEIHANITSNVTRYNEDDSLWTKIIKFLKSLFA